VCVCVYTSMLGSNIIACSCMQLFDSSLFSDLDTEGRYGLLFSIGMTQLASKFTWDDRCSPSNTSARIAVIVIVVNNYNSWKTVQDSLKTNNDNSYTVRHSLMTHQRSWRYLRNTSKQLIIGERIKKHFKKNITNNLKTIDTIEDSYRFISIDVDSLTTVKEICIPTTSLFLSRLILFFWGFTLWTTKICKLSIFNWNI